MGIGPIPAQMLRDLPLPKGFTVCELGDQIWHQGTRRSPQWWCKPARELYQSMGCTRYEAIDGNGGGTVLADLNLPFTVNHPDFTRAFDLVTDIGTSEHCFNFAQVWWTIHEMTKPGGLIFFEKPYQGFPDHGFFNQHKTLFVDLAGANGYEILFLGEHEAPRGSVWRGCYRKRADDVAPLRFPFQGKYKRKLKI
jgi:hypothetical protein